MHVELCGDTPLSDPQIIDEFIGYYLKYKKNVDFVSSASKTTYPPGFEVTLYPGKVLLEVDQIVENEDPMREHVGYNIIRFPDRFRCQILEAPPWLMEPETYLEVDTHEDLTLLRNIVGYFVSKNQEHFGLSAVLEFLRDHPDLTQINKYVERRWKTLYS